MMLTPFQLNYFWCRCFHSSSVSRHIIKLTRLRVVDNSEIGKAAMLEGKPPKCIHVYKDTGVGTIGDKILVAIKGEKKKAIIVGCKQKQKPFTPVFDTNNIVLIDDFGTPLGTRIHVPIPHKLRTILKEKNIRKGVDYTKLLALATTFVPCWMPYKFTSFFIQIGKDLHYTPVLTQVFSSAYFKFEVQLKGKATFRIFFSSLQYLNSAFNL